MDGLAQTQTDVLLRVDYLDGTSSNERLTPDAPGIVIPERPSALEVIRTYTVLGVEHILLGIDHLLFVLALLLLVRGVGRLIATVTAFTVAHSITLGAATLGFVHVPSAPVEAVIALSILFLASELARRELAASPRRIGARSGGPHGALSVDRGVLVRPAARVRIRGGAERGRDARAGRAARAAVLQRGRRDRPARCSSRRCSRSVGRFAARRRARPFGGRAPRRTASAPSRRSGRSSARLRSFDAGWTCAEG